MCCGGAGPKNTTPSPYCRSPPVTPGPDFQFEISFSKCRFPAAPRVAGELSRCPPLSPSPKPVHRINGIPTASRSRDGSMGYPDKPSVTIQKGHLKPGDQALKTLND